MSEAGGRFSATELLELLKEDPLQLEVTQTFSQRTARDGIVISNLKRFKIALRQFCLDESGTRRMSAKPTVYRITLLCNHTPVSELSLHGSSSTPQHPFTADSATEVRVINGVAEAQLQIDRAITSYHYRQHRPAGASQPSFRIRVEPADPGVAADNPGLVVTTHPFKVVTKLHPPRGALLLEALHSLSSHQSATDA